MKKDLADRHCAPCHAGAPRLAGPELRELAATLDHWDVIEEHHLARRFQFPDFVSALAFVNRIGAIAEEQGHHPDIFLTWGEVKLKIFTHAIGGLSENDFVLAAKTERAFREPR